MGPTTEDLELSTLTNDVFRALAHEREAVMLMTIDEAGSNGVPSEIAITGSGEDDPLVVLLREMLGSRLDHLDTQSEDFRSQIPL